MLVSDAGVSRGDEVAALEDALRNGGLAFVEDPAVSDDESILAPLDAEGSVV